MEDFVKLSITNDEYNLLKGSLNITIEFLQKIPFKGNDIKLKLLAMQSLKNKYFA